MFSLSCYKNFFIVLDIAPAAADDPIKLLTLNPNGFPLFAEDLQFLNDS